MSWATVKPARYVTEETIMRYYSIPVKGEIVQSYIKVIFVWNFNSRIKNM